MIRMVFKRYGLFPGARFATCAAVTALAFTGCGGSSGPEMQSNPFESAHSGRSSSAPAAPVVARSEDSTAASQTNAGTDQTTASSATTPPADSGTSTTPPATQSPAGTDGPTPVTDAGLPNDGSPVGTSSSSTQPPIPPATLVGGTTVASTGQPENSVPGSLPGTSPPSGNSPATTTEPGAASPSPADAGPKTPVLSVTLPSGRDLDLRQSTLLARADFESRLQAAAKSPNFIKAQDSGESSDETSPVGQPANNVAGNSGEEGGTDTPSSTVLYISRINGTVRGPVAVFYADGSPMLYSSYDRDSRRDEPLLSWDEQGRLQFYQEFAKGKAHGLSCVFAPVEGDSKEVTLRLVQEWIRGKLKQSYFVTDDGKAIAYDSANPLPQNLFVLAAAAESRLTNFNDSLKDNEQELRKSVAAYYRNEVRFAKAVRSAAFQQAQAQAMSSQFRMLQGLQRSSQFQQ